MSAYVLSFLIGAGFVAFLWMIDAHQKAKADRDAPVLPERRDTRSSIHRPYDGRSRPPAPPPPPPATNRVVIIATPGWSR